MNKKKPGSTIKVFILEGEKYFINTGDFYNELTQNDRLNQVTSDTFTLGPQKQSPYLQKMEDFSLLIFLRLGVWFQW